ncbi:thioesterase family protein [Thermodesulfovibrio sp. 3907-1M]|uniref:Thioesterase family protein n=1 Tax=Thermodesulfovibrio autotrophicus TaxID=3118333 RepID=A0AAU8H0W7_9BACT
MNSESFIDVPVRVKYADTDNFGIVYYGNYAIFFEKARTEYLRQKGYTYKELENNGYHLPVVEFHVKYYKPATYDDLLIIRTSIESLKSRGIVFRYEVFKEEEKIAEGFTYHICVNSENKPVALPHCFIEILKNL